MLTICKCGETWYIGEPKDFRSKKEHGKELDRHMAHIQEHLKKCTYRQPKGS